MHRYNVLRVKATFSSFPRAVYTRTFYSSQYAIWEEWNVYTTFTRKSAAFIDSTHVLSPTSSTNPPSPHKYTLTQCVTHKFPPRRFFFCDAHVEHSLYSSDRRRSIRPHSTANKTREKKKQKKICGLWVGE